MEKLLIVEDEQGLRDQLKWGLGSEHMILEGADRHQAMELFLSHSPKVVLLDMGLPPDAEGTAEGFHCLDWMVDTRPGVKIVVMSGNGDRGAGYRAIGRGAYDFYEKPIQLAELKIIIHRAFHLSRTEEQRLRLQHALEQSSAGIEGIAGQVSAMRELLASLISPGESIRAQGPGRGGEGVMQPHVQTGGRSAEQLKSTGLVSSAEVAPPPGNLTLREVRDMVEKGMITAAFGNCGGNMAKASEMLGVSRPALYDLMKKHGLSKPAHRE